MRAGLARNSDICGNAGPMINARICRAFPAPGATIRWLIMRRDLRFGGGVERARGPAEHGPSSRVFDNSTPACEGAVALKEPAMTPAQDEESEVTRLRRTFRVAVVAAAVGASIGAGVIVTV